MSFSQDLVANWDPTFYSSNKKVLPEKIITVIGKESSGTTFVAKTVATALKLPGKQKYRDGQFHHERRRYDENRIQVQHVSLPQGGWCVSNHSHHIVDFILPPQCVADKNHKYPGERNQNIRNQCQALLNSSTTQIHEGHAELHGPWFMRAEWHGSFHVGAVRYPGRVFAQSDLVRSNNVTRFQKYGRRAQGGPRRDSRAEKPGWHHPPRHPNRKERMAKKQESDVQDKGDLDDEAEDEKEPNIDQSKTLQARPLKTSQGQEHRKLQEVAQSTNDHQQMHQNKKLVKEVYVYDENHQVTTKQVALPDDDDAQETHFERLQREAQEQKEARISEDMKQMQNVKRERKERQSKNAGEAKDGMTDDFPDEMPEYMRHYLREQAKAEAEETQNERLRRENRERKQMMIRREREAAGDQHSHKKRRKRSKQEMIDEWLANVNHVTAEELRKKNLVKYPPRFILNITAQKMWYDAHGTEQVIIIVVRDEHMSFQSRLKGHCQIVELAQEEERIATGILNDAVQTFFLDDKSGFRSGFGGRWSASTVQEIMQGRFLWDPSPMIENKTDPSDLLHASLIPANNNVILVSYEAMMKYEQDYIQQLYRVLDIESKFEPEFQDGNAKYRKGYKNNVGTKGERDADDEDGDMLVAADGETHVLKLEFDGSKIILPLSIFSLVAICMLGCVSIIGFWILLFRYLFHVKYPDPKNGRRTERGRRRHRR